MDNIKYPIIIVIPRGGLRGNRFNWNASNAILY